MGPGRTRSALLPLTSLDVDARQGLFLLGRTEV